jgi:hypothetical protein
MGSANAAPFSVRLPQSGGASAPIGPFQAFYIVAEASPATLAQRPTLN